MVGSFLNDLLSCIILVIIYENYSCAYLSWNYEHMRMYCGDPSFSANEDYTISSDAGVSICNLLRPNTL